MVSNFSHAAAARGRFTRDASAFRPRAAGLLLGLSAAMAGVSVGIGPLRLWHMLVIASVVLLVLTNTRGVRIAFRFTAFDIAVIVFIITVAMIEGVNSGDLHYTYDVASVITYVFLYIAYLSARTAVRTIADATNFLSRFIFPAILITPLAVGQVVGITAISNFVLALAPSDGAESRLEDGRLTRATGLIGHWTGYGGYLIIIVAAAMAIFAATNRHKSDMPQMNIRAVRRIAALGLLCGLISLVTTLTFSVVLVAIAIVLFSSRMAGFRLQAVVIGTIVAVIASIVFGTLIDTRIDQQFAAMSQTVAGVPDWVPNTLRYRIRIWTNETIPMISQRPLTGWGNNVYAAATGKFDIGRTYPTLMSWASAESQWFGFSMTYGIIGLGALIIVILSMIHVLRKGHGNKFNFVAWPILIALVGAIIAAFTVPIFTNRGMPLALWIVLGVVVGLKTSARESRDVQSRRSSAIPSREDRTQHTVDRHGIR